MQFFSDLILKGIDDILSSWHHPHKKRMITTYTSHAPIQRPNSPPQAKYHEKDWEEEGNEKKKKPGESQTLQDHLATGRYYMSLNKLPKR